MFGQFTGPVISAILGAGVSLLVFFIGFIGEHRINRQQIEDLRVEVAALQREDREAAADRRSLSERLSHLETARIAPARGRE